MALGDIYTAEIYETIAGYLGVSLNTLVIILAIVSIWSLIWKGLALWKSARRRQIVWFIIFLLVNTVGILEILYIYVFSELRKSKQEPKKEKPKKKK